MTFNSRTGVAGLTLVFGVLALVLVQGQAKPMCDADNGGIRLLPGFCAQVVADNLGVARHMAVAPNGDLYVALQTGGGRGAPETGGGAVALRDANGDGRFEVVEKFGAGSTTGIGLRNGYVYLAHPRHRRADEADRRPAEADRCRGDDRDRASHRAAAPGQGHRLRRPRLAVHQRRRAVERLPEPRSAPGAKGQGSVPAARQARGHLEVRREQAGPDAGCRGTRFATGLRQMPAITWHDGALYIVMHNRDQLDVFWPVAVHRQGERRAAGGADVPRGARVGLRLAVLLLRLRDEDLRD